MPDETDERERLIGRNVQLPSIQWQWLNERALRSHSRSAAQELRRLLAEAMEAEQTEAIAR